MPADAGRQLTVPTFSLRGLDFLFVLAFLLGLCAMHRLAFPAREPDGPGDAVPDAPRMAEVED